MMRIEGRSSGLPHEAGLTTYVTQEGDTIHSIAERFNVPPDLLAKANCRVADSVLPAARELVIPDAPHGTAQGLAGWKDELEVAKDAEFTVPPFSCDEAPQESIKTNERMQGDVTDQYDSDLGKDLDLPDNSGTFISSNFDQVKQNLNNHLQSEENYEKFKQQDNTEVGFHDHTRPTHSGSPKTKSRDR